MKPGWDKNPLLDESALPNGALEQLRDNLDGGKFISIRCPVNVRPKRNALVQTWFDVYIEFPEDLEHVEEAYIRGDLLIGSERKLAEHPYLQKARALTVIEHDELSAFLADAEEPNHLKWNGSRPRLVEDYSNPRATLTAVRNAVPRLLALISKNMLNRDVKALVKYFTRPTGDGRTSRRSAGGGTSGGQTVEPPTVVIPPVVRKPFLIATETDKVRILPNGTARLKAGDLPVLCNLELAYEGLDQDPFKAYDPFDFDLTNEDSHDITLSGGVTVNERMPNHVQFEVTNPEFSLEISGFDPNIRLKARLDYTERSDGATVSEE